MKKIFKYYLLLCALCALCGACEPNLLKDVPSSKSYLIDDGLKQIELYDLVGVGQHEGIYKLSIQCSGIDNQSIVAKVRVNPDRLSTYNADKGTSYQLLPETCYSLASTEVKFNSREKAGLIEIKFDYARMRSEIGYEEGNYVVPVELYETTGVEMNSDKDLLLVAPILKESFVTLSPSGMKEIALGKGETYKLELSLKLPFITPVTAGFEVVVDPTLLDTYNQENELNVALFPENAYKKLEESVTAIAAGQNSGNIIYKLSATDGLGYGKYMLPLRVSNMEYYPFAGEQTLLCLITYLPGEINRSNWEILAGEDATQSGDGGGISALLDGNISTYWHARYSPGLNPPYTLIFDMKDTYEILRYEVARRQSDYAPAKENCTITIELSLDNENWTTFEDQTVVYSSDYQGFNINSTQARYVKYIHKTASGAVGHMAEFRLRGIKIE